LPDFTHELNEPSMFAFTFRQSHLQHGIPASTAARRGNGTMASNTLGAMLTHRTANRALLASATRTAVSGVLRCLPDGLIADQRGVTTMEYAMVASITILACVGPLTLISAKLSGYFATALAGFP
jgi:Flp pilus assembly pilin Flp